MSEFPKKMSLEDKDAVKGFYIVVWRKESKQPVQIVGFQDDRKRVVYDILGGPDRGRRKSAKYDETQVVVVYDDGTKILAGLEK